MTCKKGNEKIPGLVNQLWFVGNVFCRERWFFKPHSIFVVVFIFLFLSINTSNNETAYRPLPVFSDVHIGSERVICFSCCIVLHLAIPESSNSAGSI